MSGVSPADLAEHEFLRGLADRHLAQLARVASLATAKPGDRIFEEGSRADRFWLIRTGRIALDLHVPGPRRLLVETLGPGEVIGLSWWAPAHRWEFGAEAVQPTTAFELGTGVVIDMCEADPALGYQFTRRLMTVAVHRLNATRIRLQDLYGGSRPPVDGP
jgi:CRP/FNR family transcriptional regulator, cyclic AMP receptor protein